MILQFGLDVVYRLLELLFRRYKVFGGVYLDLVSLRQQLAGERIDLYDAVYLVSPELDADADLVLISGQKLDRVALGAESAPR